MLLQLGADAPERSAKLANLARSSAAAETLRGLNDLNPHGHMWWAAAQGRSGELQGILSAATKVKSIRSEFARVLEIDPGHALANYGLGRIYLELPAVLGWSIDRAEEHYRQSVAADPNCTVVRLGLAEVLSRRSMWSEAREQLELLLKSSASTLPADYALFDRPAALELLAAIPDR